MSSMRSPNSFPPYDNYRDCSQRICSTYCPQWCYFFFPPPPPFALDDNSGPNFSPLIIALIAILASAFLLVTYYILISKYCKRRRDQSSIAEIESNRNQINRHDQWQLASTGLDEALIESIAVCKYKKGDGLVEGTECAVCLGEFQENESLRLLPKCNHAFHLPCIDTWLKSHSNCPLCRASVVQSSSSLNILSLETHPENDLIMVVDDRERVVRGEEVVFGLVNDVVAPKDTFQAVNEGVEQLRRSVSLGSFSCMSHINEDEDMQMKIHQLSTGIGSSQGIRGKSWENYGNQVFDLVRSPAAAMNRSISTGKFMFPN